ncbi:GTP-binding protein Rho1 [Cladochytrium tenue]|nr:GTP-binding protein Rho1 [Cladochytrium tenue]
MDSLDELLRIPEGAGADAANIFAVAATAKQECMRTIADTLTSSAEFLSDKISDYLPAPWSGCVIGLIDTLKFLAEHYLLFMTNKEDAVDLGLTCIDVARSLTKVLSKSRIKAASHISVTRLASLLAEIREYLKKTFEYDIESATAADNRRFVAVMTWMKTSISKARAISRARRVKEQLRAYTEQLTARVNEVCFLIQAAALDIGVKTQEKIDDVDSRIDSHFGRVHDELNRLRRDCDAMRGEYEENISKLQIQVLSSMEEKMGQLAEQSHEFAEVSPLVDELYLGEFQGTKVAVKVFDNYDAPVAEVERAMSKEVDSWRQEYVADFIGKTSVSSEIGETYIAMLLSMGDGDLLALARDTADEDDLSGRIRLVVIGNSEFGKQMLVSTYKGVEHSPQHKPDSSLVHIFMDGNYWDLDIHIVRRPSEPIEADCVIAGFYVHSKRSVDRLRDDIIPNVRIRKHNAPAEVPWVIVGSYGNPSTPRTLRRVRAKVGEELGRSLAARVLEGGNRATQWEYLECSPWSGEGVEDVFSAAARLACIERSV